MKRIVVAAVLAAAAAAGMPVASMAELGRLKKTGESHLKGPILVFAGQF